MTQEEQASTQAKQDTEKGVVETVIDTVLNRNSEQPKPRGRPPRTVDKVITKKEFAKLKFKELEELVMNGKLEIKQLKAMFDSFDSIAEENKSEKHYAEIWQKYFHTGK